MTIEVIDNHSVRVDLLTGGPVLDAGCRGFRFAKWFADKGHEVDAIDPAYDIEDPGHPKIAFKRVALVSNWYRKEGFPRVCLEMGPDPEAWFTCVDGSLECDLVEYIVADDLDAPHVFDVMKLNIEGAECGVLCDWPGPVTRQIVVSFHLHTGRQTEDSVAKAVSHISQWYVPIQHEFDERYCAGRNAWDSVFILKELA